MKRIFFLIGFLLYSFNLFATVNFITSFDKAKRSAAEQKKFIFVDVMADWCGPCKVMLRVCEIINGTELTKIFFSLSRQNFQA